MLQISQMGIDKEKLIYMLDSINQSDSLTKESVATIIAENNKEITRNITEILKELGKLR